MTDECRAAFEKWGKTSEWRYGYGRRTDGSYESSHTQIMWEAWQAGGSARAPDPAKPYPRPILGKKLPFYNRLGLRSAEPVPAHVRDEA